MQCKFCNPSAPKVAAKHFCTSCGPHQNNARKQNAADAKSISHSHGAAHAHSHSHGKSHSHSHGHSHSHSHAHNHGAAHSHSHSHSHHNELVKKTKWENEKLQKVFSFLKVIQESLWLQALIALLAIINVIVSLSINNFVLNNIYLKVVLSSLFVFFFGLKYWQVYPKLLKKEIGMMLLIAVASHSVYLYSLINLVIKVNNGASAASIRTFFDVPIILMFIVKVGQFLESKLTKQVEANLENMFIENIKTVTLVNGKTTALVSIHDLAINDQLLIKKGQMIPVDAELISQQSWVDTTNINGESIPRNFLQGQLLKSGMINLETSIKVKVLKAFKDSTVYYLLNKLEAMMKRKTHLQKISATITKYFAPFILSLGLFTFSLWALLYGTKTVSLDNYLYRNFVSSGYEAALLNAATVLSIACPCAFGLAAPVVHALVNSIATKSGIIYNQINRFENLKKIDYLFLDKTGTLSKNTLKIVDYQGSDENQKLIASMEQNSSHPFARSILKDYQKALLNLENVKEEIGFGLIYKSAQTTYYLSNPKKLAAKLKLEMPFHLINSADHIVALATKDKLLAHYRFRDEIKNDFKPALKRFKKMAKAIIVLSGDSEKRVQAIVKNFNLTRGYGNLNSQAKLKIIEEYQKKGTVAFIGDGLNDALAIQGADLGIAFEHGSNITNHVAAASLKTESLKIAALALELPLKTRKAILINFFWAFIFNLICLPLAILGILPIYLGATVMFASTSVLLLHTLWFKIRLQKLVKS